MVGGGNLPEEDVVVLENSWSKIVNLLKPAYRHRITYVQDLNKVVALALKQSWPEYMDLLGVIDLYLESNLGNVINKLIQEEPLNKDLFRYVFLTSMVLAREFLCPTFSIEPKKFAQHGHIALPIPGQMIPNVSISIDGIIAGQFDAIMVPKGTIADGSNFDLLEYLESKKPWGFLEIKTPFRTRRITGGWKRNSPFGEDLQQLRHRLGHLIIDWDQRHNNFQERTECPDPKYSLFPLPEAAIVCYLRGVQPSAVININPKSDNFLHDWLRRVEYSVWPVDILGGDEEDGENVDKNTWEERMNKMGEISGETHQLFFPLWALAQIARDQLNNEADLERVSITGTMVPLGGLEVPVDEVLPKNKRVQTRKKRKSKNNQDFLF